jgi:transcriptional regulator with GAF, ATPase, and Fis domain
MISPFSASLARTLEQVEIVRSALRWSPHLDRDGIDRILRQVEALRGEILLFSGSRAPGAPAEHPLKPASASQRRKNLLRGGFRFEGIFGENPQILSTLETAAKAARTDLPVLIEGESGTGKELLAKVIHANSPRAGKPMITVNCGAIAPHLLESELFGHVRGAFTGAVKDRKGRFEAAQGGVLFLDEIGELPLDSQVKLLRVLESGEVQRVGSDSVVFVDVRIIAATNRCLEEMLKENRFREDLYYRLNVVPLNLPPLRERKDEIPLLIDYFTKEAAEHLNRTAPRIAAPLGDFLLSYRYPGNIRELRNMIYHIACTAEGVADSRHLPAQLRSRLSENAVESKNDEETSLEGVRNAAVDAAERAFLENHLRDVDGNVAALARRLRMNRSYLQTLLKKRGLQAKDFRG